jgi:hypothetical protein
MLSHFATSSVAVNSRAGKLGRVVETSPVFSNCLRMESFVLFNSSANRVVFWETFLFFNTMSGCFAVDLEDLVEDFLFLAFDFFMTVEELCLWWWWWTRGENVGTNGTKKIWRGRLLF